MMVCSELVAGRVRLAKESGSLIIYIYYRVLRISDPTSEPRPDFGGAADRAGLVLDGNLLLAVVAQFDAHLSRLFREVANRTGFVLDGNLLPAVGAWSGAHIDIILADFIRSRTPLSRSRENVIAFLVIPPLPAVDDRQAALNC